MGKIQAKHTTMALDNTHSNQRITELETELEAQTKDLLTVVRHQQIVILDANAQQELKTLVLEEELAEAKKDSRKVHQELESLRNRFAVVQSELVIFKHKNNHQQRNLLPPQQPQRRPSCDAEDLTLQQVAAEFLKEQQHAITKEEFDQFEYEYCLIR